VRYTPKSRRANHDARPEVRLVSYRQQFTGWINMAKRKETRQRRIDESVALLARGEKLGMR